MPDLPTLENFYPYAVKLAKVAAILLGALVASRIARRVTVGLQGRFAAVMTKREKRADQDLLKRAETIGGIIRKTASVAIWGLAMVMMLNEIGFNIGPILAGAGIIGLAVGFGAQNLVRDVISGLFMLIENQIRVHDWAVINGTSGLVEEINLRTTVLRSQDGSVHIFPNGSITSLSNKTREFSYYVFDIGVAYKEDTDHVVEAVREEADQLMQEDPFKDYILAPIEFLGVDQFADSAVIIKARFKTVPLKQWVVGREMNRRIKKKFDRVGIEIPFPHRSLYFGEASKPIHVQSQAPDRETIEKIVREILKENGWKEGLPGDRKNQDTVDRSEMDR